jgi:hypothetical protein
MAAAYPLTLTFKITLVGAQLEVVDAGGTLVSYVKQKAFKLKEDVTIFADRQQTQPVFHLKANKVIDIGATYAITTDDGRPVGSVKQRGMRTFWKATYDVLDVNGETVAMIHEENPWVKVLDGLIGQIPIAGFLLQQWVSPAYVVEGTEGVRYLRLRKRPSLIERRFELDRENELPRELERVAMPAVLMVVLLERGRG